MKAAMLTFPRLAPLLFAATLTLGCHAQLPAVQTPATATVPGPTVGQPLPPALARRVEVLLRQKAQVPPGSTINIGTPAAAELSGYDTVTVSITTEGKTSRPISFLLSTDGKSLAQMTKYDLTPDPRNYVSAAGRPARGGPETAPVLIVGFDDLECPFCARLHQTIFPAIEQRYGNNVRIVYRDYPIEQHPWAMRGAVDVNCLAAQSPTGYWNAVDYIHSHETEIGTPATDPAKPNAPKDKSLATANEQLDKLTRQQGEFQKVDMTKLNACIAKQDTTEMEKSRQLGTALNVDSTPTLFINGDKIDGAVPIEFIFKVIDDALVAEGKTPPPPYAPQVAAPAAAKPSGK
jgi:protein-disulfide isomerase